MDKKQDKRISNSEINSSEREEMLEYFQELLESGVYLYDMVDEINQESPRMEKNYNQIAQDKVYLDLMKFNGFDGLEDDMDFDEYLKGKEAKKNLRINDTVYNLPSDSFTFHLLEAFLSLTKLFAYFILWPKKQMDKKKQNLIPNNEKLRKLANQKVSMNLEEYYEDSYDDE